MKYIEKWKQESVRMAREEAESIEKAMAEKNISYDEFCVAHRSCHTCTLRQFNRYKEEDCEETFKRLRNKQMEV